MKYKKIWKPNIRVVIRSMRNKHKRSITVHNFIFVYFLVADAQDEQFRGKEKIKG